MAVWERGEAEGATGAFMGLMLAVGGGSNELFSEETPLVDGLEVPVACFCRFSICRCCI